MVEEGRTNGQRWLALPENMLEMRHVTPLQATHRQDLVFVVVEVFAFLSLKDWRASFVNNVLSKAMAYVCEGFCSARARPKHLCRRNAACERRDLNSLIKMREWYGGLLVVSRSKDAILMMSREDKAA